MCQSQSFLYQAVRTEQLQLKGCLQLPLLLGIVRAYGAKVIWGRRRNHLQKSTRPVARIPGTAARSVDLLLPSFLSRLSGQRSVSGSAAHAHFPPLYSLAVTSVPPSQPITVMLARCTPLLVAIKVRRYSLSARAAWLVYSHRFTLFLPRFSFTLVFSFSFQFRSFFLSFSRVSFLLSLCSMCILGYFSLFFFPFLLLVTCTRYSMLCGPSSLRLTPCRYRCCLLTHVTVCLADRVLCVSRRASTSVARHHILPPSK